MIRLAAFFVSIQAQSMSGSVDDRMLIVGGDRASIQNYEYAGMYFALNHCQPLIVSMSLVDPVMKTITHVCSGSLIARNVVLTAAHCVNDIALDKTVVIAGTDNYLTASEDQMYTIATVSHPGFQYDSFAVRNDIALLFLEDCVDFNGTFPSLARNTTFDQKCAMVEAIGFGRAEQVSKMLYVSEGLLRRTGPGQYVHSDSICQEAFMSFTIGTKFKSAFVNRSIQQLLAKAITKKIGCYGGDRMSVRGGYPCDGDSGGPVINSETGVIIGVSSFSSEMCGNMPNYFTRVSSYIDWIRAEMDAKASTCVNPSTEQSVPRRRLASDPTSSSSFNEALSLIGPRANTTCSNQLRELHISSNAPRVNVGNLQNVCTDFSACIDSLGLGKTVELANTILNTYPFPITHDSKLELVDQIVMSRILLCTSALETFYRTLDEQDKINSNFMDKTLTNGECNVIVSR